MRFVYPWILAGLPCLFLLAIVLHALKQRAAQRIAQLVPAVLQDKLSASGLAQSHTVTVLQNIMLFTGLTLLIIAAARPQWGREQQRLMSKSRNLVIAIDVSRSMLATDVHPNRLERSKADVTDLISELKGDRAALLAFRKKGALLCPLTTDYAFLRQALDALSPESAPPGETDIGDAINKALEALDPARAESNAILLISDGEDLTNEAKAAAATAAKMGTPIFTVGIGSDKGAAIPKEGGGTVQFNNQTVTTKLTESTLSAIAEISGGQYIPLATAGTAHTTLGAIYRSHLRSIAQQEQEELLRERMADRYQYFIIPAILLLCLAGGLSQGRFANARRRRIAAGCLAALLCLNANAQTNDTQEATPPATNAVEEVEIVVPAGRLGARKAQSFYKKGEFKQAGEAYLSAARGTDAAESQLYRYNAAVAFWKAEEFDRAAETASQLILSREYGAQASDLLGAVFNAKAQAEKEDVSAKFKLIERAADAAQEAVRYTPNDVRREQNLTRALAPLADVREGAHIQEVLKKYGQSQPPQLTATMLENQRKLYKTADAAFTNAPAAMISAAERLADEQTANADIWIALKKGVLESPSFTNEQQRVDFAQRVEVIRDSMKTTAERFKDLDTRAADGAKMLEAAAYPFWQAMALPPALLDEDIAVQSNTLENASNLWAAREDRPEALALTEGFIERFPEWAKQMEQQIAQKNVEAAQNATTNAAGVLVTNTVPEFTKAQQEEIKKLADETQALQKQLVAKPDKPNAQKALDNLHRIKELLPKDPNQNQQQNQQQQQQDQQQDQQQNQDQQQDQQQDQEDQKKEEQQQSDDKKDEKPQDVQALLQRALEREQEHEEDKKQRLKNLPMRPDERDW